MSVWTRLDPQWVHPEPSRADLRSKVGTKPETMINLISSVRFRRDHQWTTAHLSDFVDGDLSARGRSRLQRHVDKCPDCYRALVTLQRMLDRLHRLPPPHAVAPDIAAAVRRRLREQPED